MSKKIKTSSNKNFGIVFSIFFLLVAFYPLINNDDFRVWSLVISIIFLILGLVDSSILTPLNLLWFRFGILLGRIVSPIIMSLIFFVVVTPLAILAKIVKKDFLNLDKKKNLKRKTYWEKKEKYNNSMKDQF
jgi:polyferredoxin